MHKALWRHLFLSHSASSTNLQHIFISTCVGYFSKHHIFLITMFKGTKTWLKTQNFHLCLQNSIFCLNIIHISFMFMLRIFNASIINGSRLPIVVFFILLQTPYFSKLMVIFVYFSKITFRVGFQTNVFRSIQPCVHAFSSSFSSWTNGVLVDTSCMRWPSKMIWWQVGQMCYHAWIATWLIMHEAFSHFFFYV